MSKDKLREEALLYHSSGKPGKIEVIPTKSYNSQKDLSLAYSPGVAVPCLEIEKNPDDAYKYTVKGNLVGVISNGTAVLGLGDIGALAGKPVMEGKGLLFKIFADIDVFDIEVDTTDVDEFVKTVKNIAPTFGGINLEDIKAPECFEIERRLVEELDIPVMHDDQHGTAIISSAALLNAAEIAGKNLKDLKVVVNGAGASAVACTRLYISLGVDKNNIVMCDSKGVIRADNPHLTETKRYFATKKELRTLKEAMVGADLFLGLSVANVLTEEMVKSMAKDPIVFALANPDPEIEYSIAIKSRNDIIFATGRSDYPNQVNNVLGFPYIFRGALDVRAKKINESMKIAAVKALAELAKKPVPEIVATAYNNDNIVFGREYLIPKPFDPRLLGEVSIAVAKAAIESGVARIHIEDWEAYSSELNRRIGRENKLIRAIRSKVQNSEIKRVVFSDATKVNTLKAALLLKNEGLAEPILVGNKKDILTVAKDNKLDIDESMIFDFRGEKATHIRQKYAKVLFDNLQRKGMTITEAVDKMMDKDYFSLMMRYCGDADVSMLSYTSRYAHKLNPVKDVFGFDSEYHYWAAMTILHTTRGYMFFADTNVNTEQNVGELVEVTKLVNKTVKKLGYEPVIAMLSYSNFGKCSEAEPKMVAKAVKQLHSDYPEILVDGEMQANYAINGEKRFAKFPFNKLTDRDVNTFVFPNIASSNIAYKILTEFDRFELLGPILIGGPRGVQLFQDDLAVQDIVNITAFASVEVTCGNNDNCLI